MTPRDRAAVACSVLAHAVDGGDQAAIKRAFLEAIQAGQDYNAELQAATVRVVEKPARRPPP